MFVVKILGRSCLLRLRVRPFATAKFLTGVHKIVFGSNFVAFILFTTRKTEDFVVEITNSKTKNFYSSSNSKVYTTNFGPQNRRTGEETDTNTLYY